ncbi:Histone acetyltransferase (MYST family), partial [Pseudoloma neurophilia]
KNINLTNNTDKEKNNDKNLTQFFVHYINYNKRLDEWLTGDTFILESVEIPKRRRGPFKKRSKINSPLIDSSINKSDNKNILNQPDNENDTIQIKIVNHLFIRNKRIETWYFSPFPSFIKEKVYICPGCLFYLDSVQNLKKHLKTCKMRHPPGKEIYRHENLSFFELDGHIYKNYCRNISLISKCFLDHKTLFYDVDLFMFYVLVRYNPGVPLDDCSVDGVPEDHTIDDLKF